MSQQFSPDTLNEEDGNNQCSPNFKTFYAGIGALEERRYRDTTTAFRTHALKHSNNQ